METLFGSAVACGIGCGKRRFDSIRTRQPCQELEACRLLLHLRSVGQRIREELQAA